ncbi:tripartite tricarboxylate transporter TctB family protein [Jiangella mangrovi]|uniref:DUF1468 domain-containing protein n=1 Tax=Jiangella mangrovi TaxID=1524084 RepID=A0A7W9GP70_9ACTN|nr:tripartite tricarboxylate transporter TctB family protein [Jiangella mangrovi]MBB5787253.1 hypothetical protein [Jiangella mangrovi]
MAVDGTADRTPPSTAGGGRWAAPEWSAMRGKRQGRLVFGIVLLLVAAGYTWEAFQIPLGTAAQPGAGMFPRFVGVATAIVALILVAESLFSAEKTEDIDLPQGRQLRLVLAFAGCTLGFILLLPVLGQYVAGALYMTLTMKFLGSGSWWKAIVYGVVLSSAIAWIFINLLHISLPGGVFAA